MAVAGNDRFGGHEQVARDSGSALSARHVHLLDLVLDDHHKPDDLVLERADGRVGDALARSAAKRRLGASGHLFKPLVRPEPAQQPVVTWAALSPLALPDLPEEIGRRLVEEHLLDTDRFWLPFPPPSVPANHRSFSRREATLGIRRYWRGPTWINAAWLLWLGLVRLGYCEQAARVGESVTDAVAREGLREYYDPYTGRGMGATDFGWSSLVMEMLKPDPRASLGYIGRADGRRR